MRLKKRPRLLLCAPRRASAMPPLAPPPPPPLSTAEGEKEEDEPKSDEEEEDEGLPCADAAARASYARRTELDELRRAFEALSSGAGASSSKQGSEKTDLPPPLSAVITPASLAAAALSVGHALDATAAKDAVWEVDDDLDGAVNWREFKAAAARVAWGGAGGFGGVVGGKKNASSSPSSPSSSSPVASPSSSPSPLSRRGGSSSAILLDAASDAHPRTLVDIGLFLARADKSTGRLATSALERAAHLRDGRGAVRSALADAAEAAAAAAGTLTTSAATTSISLGEYLEARRGAQARALRAPPPSPLLASQQPSSSHAAAVAVAAATGGAIASSAAASKLKHSSSASRGGTSPRIAAPRR